MHFDCGQYRHVAGAVRDRHHQPAPRLPAVELGHVLADGLGLGVYVGTLGFFMTCIFLFVRVLPMITIFELRMLLPGARVKEPVAQ